MDIAVASHVHRDLTSSDIVDTAQALALRDANVLVLAATDRLFLSLADQTLNHKRTVCLARTHGQAAAPDVFGHRLADFAFAVDRAAMRLRAAQEQVSVAAVSGPVGTHVGLGPEVERLTAERLGLVPAPVTTQVVFRDGVAAWVAALALLVSTCEAVALEVRLGQQDSLLEIFEPAGCRQEGSSAMPHKKNPISSEKVCGLARVVRGYVSPVLEDVALWQHRDISHSSVERVVLPDAAALSEHVVTTTATVVEGLVVDSAAMLRNLERVGAKAASSRMLSALLQDGVDRRAATAQVRELTNDPDDAPSSTDDSYGDENRASEPPVELDRAIAEVLDSAGLTLVFERLAVRRRQVLDRSGDVPQRRDGELLTEVGGQSARPTKKKLT